MFTAEEAASLIGRRRLWTDLSRETLTQISDILPDKYTETVHLSLIWVSLNIFSIVFGIVFGIMEASFTVCTRNKHW